MEWRSTHVSLLQRLRDPSDSLAWRDFDVRYGDLLLRYARGRGLQQADAEDIRQIVLLSLSKSLPKFEYSPDKGRFRNYLGRTVRNAISHWATCPNRGHQALSNWEASLAADPADDSTDDQWDQEWVRHHYRLAMETMQVTHDPESLRIFDRLLAGDSVADVASAFGSSVQAVHKVKQRIRDRLQELIAAQIREEDGFFEP